MGVVGGFEAECWFKSGITLINLGIVPMSIIRVSSFNKN